MAVDAGRGPCLVRELSRLGLQTRPWGCTKHPSLLTCEFALDNFDAARWRCFTTGFDLG